MKYMSKIEWFLRHDDFMEASEEASVKSSKTKQIKGSLTDKDVWSIVSSNIKKKLNNPKSVKGICPCESGVLCDHRKEYIIQAFK